MLSNAKTNGYRPDESISSSGAHLFCATQRSKYMTDDLKLILIAILLLLYLLISANYLNHWLILHKTMYSTTWITILYLPIEQLLPIHPVAHLLSGHCPVTGSHVWFLMQWQLCAQLSPNEPLRHAVDVQSGTRLVKCWVRGMRIFKSLTI